MNHHGRIFIDYLLVRVHYKCNGSEELFERIEDIVTSAWKHVAVRMCGKYVTNTCEGNGFASIGDRA